MTNVKEIPLNHILDHIQDAVVTLDTEWRVTYLNRAAEQFAGRPAAELLGKSAWEFLPQTPGSHLFNELHRAAVDRQPRHFAEYCPGIDRWLEADLYPSADGSVIVARDITGAKKQAREGEERLRLALSFGRMGVWEFDIKTRIVKWSPELEAVHGLPAGSFDGKHESTMSLVHPEDRAGLYAAYFESVKSRGVLAHEFRVTWPDGTVHSLYARGKVICDETGEPSTMLGITADITEQKRAASELQRKLEQMEVLSSLAAAVNLAREPAEIYHAAIQGLTHAVGADRASVLIFDPDDVMRFKAWTGLSDEYRKVCAGHSPWPRGTPNAQPIAVPDVLEDPSLSSLWPALAKEGIRAAAFIPLMGHGGVIGKFMLYYDQPHEFRAEELKIAQTIAAQVGFATERRHAEIALQASEERFRATFFQAAVGITEANVSGELRLVNDRFCEILGYSRAELLGKSFLEITHPDHRQACLEGIHGLLTGELSSYTSEKRYLRKDGTPVWALANVSLVRDQNQQPQYFVGVVEDVSERVHAERALRESEQRLTLALSAARLEVWDCDLREESVTVSPAYAELRGSPRTGSDWITLIHPDDREGVVARVAESVAKKSDWAGEFRVLLPDGNIRWVHSLGAVQLDDAGEAARLVGVSLDVTDRKQAETALRESEELFRNLADTAPVMMWMTGPDKLCTFFNKTWLTFTGRALEQELGHGWAEGIHPDDAYACFTSYCSAFDARNNFHIEYRLRRADGEYRWLLCSGVPHFTPSGAFAGYIGSDIDITDLKRAQTEAVERQKLESLGVLTGGIAHDFNNLLGSVLADAELAELDVASGASPLEQIQRIKSVAVRASEIVRELMIYSGQDHTDLGSVDLSRLVGEMLELLKVSVSKHAVLKADLCRDLPAVLGNAAQLRQVVMNLIINASEALGEHDGVIRVTTSLAGSGRNLPSFSAANLPVGDYLRLEVSDTGCGITKEQQDRIFDPFFSTKFPGRGLGLAVVHGIVRAHAGAIQLDSTPGQGTKFQIFLPCSSNGHDRNLVIQVPAALAETNGSSATLLLVEDEEQLRVAVAKMLSRRGFSVLGAADGTAAVDLLRSHPTGIDIILLDMTLPGATSREVIAEAQRTRPGVKVVLTSAYSREAVTHSVDTPIVKGFIRKPFQIGELVNLLRTTLDGE